MPKIDLDNRVMIHAKVREFDRRLYLEGSVPLGNTKMPVLKIKHASKSFRLSILVEGRGERYKHWGNFLRRLKDKFGLDREFKLIAWNPILAIQFNPADQGNALSIIVRGKFTV